MIDRMEAHGSVDLCADKGWDLVEQGPSLEERWAAEAEREHMERTSGGGW